MNGHFWVTWYQDNTGSEKKRKRTRLQCNPRTPSEGASDKSPEWTIDPQQLELSRDLDVVDSQLARMADEWEDFDHNLYARSLIAAAVTGLDGSNASIEAREVPAITTALKEVVNTTTSSEATKISAGNLTETAGRGASVIVEKSEVSKGITIPGPGPVHVAMARDRIEAMRNDLLMALERRVKDEELSLLAVRVIAFAALPWLLLLVPQLSVGWLIVPFLMAAAGAMANGLGSLKKGSISHCPWLMFPGVLGVVALAIWVVSHDANHPVNWLEAPGQPRPNDSWPPLQNYVLFWNGTMLGVWLAVGSRLRKMQFAELLVPNQDQFQVWVRLLRAGVFALLLALLLSFGPPTVLFSIEAHKLFQQPGLAFAFGLVFGLAELLLPQAAGAKAEGLFKTVNNDGLSRS